MSNLFSFNCLKVKMGCIIDGFDGSGTVVGEQFNVLVVITEL